MPTTCKHQRGWRADRAQAAEGPAQEGQGEGEVCHGSVAADDGPRRGLRPNAADAALPPASPARTQLGSQAPPGEEQEVHRWMCFFQQMRQCCC